jgi:hypothetical protein
MVSGSDFQYSGTTRKHYIRAEEVVWDYAPLGENALYGRPFTEEERVFTEVCKYLFLLCETRLVQRCLRAVHASSKRAGQHRF